MRTFDHLTWGELPLRLAGGGPPLLCIQWGWCSRSGSVIAQIGLDAPARPHRLGWVVWDGDSGTLLRGFRPTDEYVAAVVPTETSSVLVVGGIGCPVEGWGVDSGELLWRNPSMSFDTSNVEVTAGRCGARSVVEVSVGTKSRRVSHLDPATGKLVNGDGFARSSGDARPPPVNLQPPTWGDLPYAITMSVPERALGALRGVSASLRSASANALRDWLDTPSRGDEGGALLVPRPLRLTSDTSRLLRRILHAEGRPLDGSLPRSAAKALAARAPWPNDDLLGLFAARSATLRDRWGIDPERLHGVEAGRHWQYVQRLAPVCPRGRAEGSLAVQAPDRLATVKGYLCVGGLSLSSWLSGEAWFAEEQRRMRLAEAGTPRSALADDPPAIELCISD